MSRDRPQSLAQLQAEWRELATEENGLISPIRSTYKICALGLQPHVEREAADLKLMRRMLKEVELMRPDTDLHDKGMCRTCDLIREVRARLEESKP